MVSRAPSIGTGALGAVFSDVPFVVDGSGVGLLGVASTAGVMWGGSAPFGVSPGTSRLWRMPRLWGSGTAVGLVWMGKRLSAPPVERSLRCARPFMVGDGAGLGARDLEAIARLRASMLARRLLSSVLGARGLGLLGAISEWFEELARFSSPKISSL